MCWNGLQIEALMDCDDLSGGDFNSFVRRVFRFEGTSYFFKDRLESTVELLLVRLCRYIVLMIRTDKFYSPPVVTLL